MKATTGKGAGALAQAKADAQGALQRVSATKGWRKMAGKLRDTAFAREADRLGREYRAKQNES